MIHTQTYNIKTTTRFVGVKSRMPNKHTLALMPTHARCSLRMLPICGAAPILSCEGRAIYTYSRGRRSASPRLPAPHLMSPRPPPTARDDLGLRPPHWRAGRHCLEGAVAALCRPCEQTSMVRLMSRTYTPTHHTPSVTIESRQHGGTPARARGYRSTHVWVLI